MAKSIDRETVEVRAVLLNLLPGLRDLRAPFAAGAIWFVSLWLVTGSTFQQDTQKTKEPIASLVVLANLVGRPATLTALGFSIYLLGIVSGSVTTFAFVIGNRFVILRPFRWMNPGARNRGLADSPLYSLVWGRVAIRLMSSPMEMSQSVSHYLVNSDSSLVREYRKDHGFRGQTDLIKAWTEEAQSSFSLAYSLAGAVIDAQWYLSGIDALIARDLVAVVAPEVTEQADRLRAEADLRTSLILPLSALGVAAGIYNPFWALALFPVAILMIYLGDRLSGQADAVLSAGILAGKVGQEQIDLLMTGRIHYTKDPPPPRLFEMFLGRVKGAGRGRRRRTWFSLAQRSAGYRMNE